MGHVWPHSDNHEQVESVFTLWQSQSASSDWLWMYSTAVGAHVRNYVKWPCSSTDYQTESTYSAQANSSRMLEDVSLPQTPAWNPPAKKKAMHAQVQENYLWLHETVLQMLMNPTIQGWLRICASACLKQWPRFLLLGCWGKCDYDQRLISDLCQLWTSFGFKWPSLLWTLDVLWQTACQGCWCMLLKIVELHLQLMISHMQLIMFELQCMLLRCMFILHKINVLLRHCKFFSQAIDLLVKTTFASTLWLWHRTKIRWKCKGRRAASIR